MIDVAVLQATRVLDAGAATELWRTQSAPALAPSFTPSFTPPAPVVIELDGEPIILVSILPSTELGWFRRAARAYPIDHSVMRDAGIRNKGKVFGFMGANPLLKRSSCSSCSGAVDAPQAHADLCQLAEALAVRLFDLLPGVYAENVAAVAGVLPEWKLPGGLWTSGVLNETSTLPYHRDRNNFDAWSAMAVARRGTFGGHLHFPELEVDGEPLVLPCSDGTVVYFNGQEWMHGVTPIVKRQPDGYRYSAVYYPVRKMANCLSARDEAARANTRRTASEATLVERQRAAGILGQL